MFFFCCDFYEYIRNENSHWDDDDVDEMIEWFDLSPLWQNTGKINMKTNDRYKNRRDAWVFFSSQQKIISRFN